MTDFALNERTWNAPEVVTAFARRSSLQPAEAVILALLDGELPKSSVLDIGVGGGRTSVYLLPRARAYRAIDSSPGMIAACRQRFPEQRQLFQVGDARRLGDHTDGAYDIVLFSFNGIDYVSHGDRLVALGEIRRVTRRGGWFCMSSHNLGVIDVRLPPKPFTLEALSRAITLRLLNLRQNWSRRSRYLIVRDMLRTLTYHVSPSEQVRQLAAAGFSSVEIVDGRGGRISVRAAERCKDPWLYYLCR
jgi:ubiquinone/menaquinone biosynthesis C-methylase UbiE